MTTRFPVVSFLLLLLAFTNYSCTTSDEVKTVKVENRFSLTIPSFLAEVHNLNEDASLQYQHAWKEFYVIVIEDSKKEMALAILNNDLSSEYSNDLQGYSNIVLYNFEGSHHSFALEDTSINNLPAKLFSTRENIDGIEVFYSIGIIEGKENFYQVMSWTLASKEFEHKAKMKSIINSFREI